MNAGKLSPQVGARIDPQIRPFYDAGAQVLKNFIAMVEGPIIKRPGFVYIRPAHLQNTSFKLVPFYNAASRFVLEVSGTDSTSDCEVRFLQDGVAAAETAQSLTGSPTAANPVSIPLTSHGYSTGDEVLIAGSAMSELNGRYFSITVTGLNAFTLDGEDGTGRSTGAGGTAAKTYHVRPFLTGDLRTIQWEQDQDVLYLVHSSRPPTWYSPNAHNDWEFDGLFAGNDWPLFEFDSTSGVTMQASATVGSITLTASSAIFTAEHVGRAVRLTDITTGIGTVDQDSGGEGFVEIDSVTSPPSTTASATVRSTLDANVVSSPTTRWAWSVVGNPTAIASFDDRLWLSGIEGYEGQIWASRIGSILNPESFARNATDVGALHFRLQKGGNQEVRWLRGMDEVLIVGTASDEQTVTSIDSTAAIAAGNIKARRRSARGARDGADAVEVDDRVIFVHRAGRKAYDFRYRIELNEVTASDLTKLSRESTQKKLAEMQYQQEPYNVIWNRMDDGSITALTYDQRELVAAWQDVELGGGPTLLSHCILPSDTDSSDEVWAITERTINGSAQQYIERMNPFWEEGDALETCVFVDCAWTYDGAAATTFSGLDHLEGETVWVLADGVRLDDVTIADGSFSISTAASQLAVGYGYDADYLSMPIEAGSADGTSQGKLGSIARIMLRLYQTGEGLFYGRTLDDDDLRVVPIRAVGDAMDTPVPVFDGDKDDLLMPAHQEQRRTVALRHRAPLPCTIVGAFPRLEAR
ncbi:MAG: hypothetical protein NXI30_04510 [bacterium]|nr:hypothetical protein [bacterium]